MTDKGQAFVAAAAARITAAGGIDTERRARHERGQVDARLPAMAAA